MYHFPNVVHFCPWEAEILESMIVPHVLALIFGRFGLGSVRVREKNYCFGPMWRKARVFVTCKLA